MLSRIFRFLSVATLGVSIASVVIVTLLSFLFLASAMFQSCVGSYRQAHPDLELIMDSIGFPLMGWAFAAMSWKMSELCNDTMVDCSFNWVLLHDGVLLSLGLLMVAGSNLTIAVFASNRFAAIWSYCRAAADTG